MPLGLFSKLKKMGVEGLEPLKAFSAEAVTFLSNDPKLTAGDQVQTNTGGRFSLITSSGISKYKFLN